VRFAAGFVIEGVEDAEYPGFVLFEAVSVDGSGFRLGHRTTSLQKCLDFRFFAGFRFQLCIKRILCHL
jgi:hypothetical protein